MTLPTASSSKPSARSASVTRTMPLASNGTGTPPSKSDPSPTWSIPATPPRRRPTGRSRPHPRRRRPSARTRSRPCPPVAAMPRSWSSDEVAGVVGDAANAGVGRDDRPPRDRRGRRRSSAPTSGPGRRSSTARSSSATSSRPSAVNPPFSTPCADPATALSKKWASPTIRYPAASIASRPARSSPRAWAPSIASRPADDARDRSARRARNASRSAADRTTRQRATRPVRGVHEATGHVASPARSGSATRTAASRGRRRAA